jgi:hypothetical protein
MDVRAILAVFVGAIILFGHVSWSATARRRHDLRLGELRAGAEESFFEERRSLEAYRPPRRELTWRLLGAALVLGGLWSLYEGR